MLTEKQVQDRLSRMPEGDELKSTKFCADFFGVSQQSIRDWIAKGHLEARPRITEHNPHGVTAESIRKLFRDTYLPHADGEAA